MAVRWADVDLGFSGFRIHAPINSPDYYDEVCVFLAASYFWAIAKGETYGLSARELSIDTGEAKGEEFPVFKAFWLEKPAPNVTSVAVHALHSKSAAAGHRFTIRPGESSLVSKCRSIPEWILHTRRSTILRTLTSSFVEIDPEPIGPVWDARAKAHRKSSGSMEFG